MIVLAVPLFMAIWLNHAIVHERREQARWHHYAEQLPPTCQDPKTALQPWNEAWCQQVTEEIAKANRGPGR